MKNTAVAGLALVLVARSAVAQTFQRLGGCPDLGCIFPPDQYVSYDDEVVGAAN